MPDKMFEIAVRGKRKHWQLEFIGDEKYWQDWLDDGLDVRMIENIIPECVVDLRLTKIWCFFQDLLRG